MKVKCINPKNYNLTLDKEYDVVEEHEQRYTIVNDNGKEVYYNKALFEVVKDTEFTVEVDYDNNSFGIEIYNGEEVLLCEDYNLHEVANNCGVTDFGEVNDLFYRIKSDVGGNIVEVFTDVILAMLSELHGKYGMILFSTNKDYPEIWDVLDELCDFSSESIVDPNSDNDIKLWGMYLNK